MISHVRFNHECCANFIKDRKKKEKAEEKYKREREREKELDELFSFAILDAVTLVVLFFRTLQYLMK